MADNDDKIKISELSQALNLDNTSETVVNKQVSGSWTTFKMTIATLASHILEVFSTSSLKTNNKTVVGAVNQTISNLAEDFNTTAGSTYAENDCVLYNGNLYKCTNASGTTSGTFIDADWTQVKAVDVGSGGGGGGSSTLAGLSDVNLSSPSNNQVLKYNATSHKWENGAGGSSGDHITLTQAEYDALVQAGTVDPDAFYFIEDAQLAPHSYSTSEQIVGTWVDGSPIYEKTIYNAGGVTGNFNFQHGITNFGKLLSYEGTVSDSSFAQYGDIWVVPRIASDGNSIGIDKVSTSSIYIINPNAFGTRLFDWYITLRYTKSSS